MSLLPPDKDMSDENNLIGLSDAIDKVLNPGGENLSIRLFLLNLNMYEGSSKKKSARRFVAVALAPGCTGNDSHDDLTSKAIKTIMLGPTEKIEFRIENPIVIILESSIIQKVQKLFSGADAIEVENCVAEIVGKKCLYDGDMQWVIDGRFHDEREAKAALLSSIAEKHFEAYKKTIGNEVYTVFQDFDLSRRRRRLHKEIDTEVQVRLDRSNMYPKPVHEIWG